MPDVREAEQAVKDPKTAETVEGSEGGSKSTPVVKIAVIAAVAIIAVAAGYLVTAMVLKPMMAHDPSAASEEAAEVVEPSHGGGGHGEGAEAGEQALFEVKQIIVNPASTVGSRFLSCSVAFEVASAADLQVFESREIQIRDALITILSARTVDELADVQFRESLRVQMLERVNQLGDPAKATAVYFKDFVLQ